MIYIENDDVKCVSAVWQKSKLCKTRVLALVILLSFWWFWVAVKTFTAFHFFAIGYFNEIHIEIEWKNTKLNFIFGVVMATRRLFMKKKTLTFY